MPGMKKAFVTRLLDERCFITGPVRDGTLASHALESIMTKIATHKAPFASAAESVVGELK